MGRVVLFSIKGVKTVTELKIQKSVREEETYTMAVIQALAVYLALVAVFAAYFSVFKIDISIWAAEAIMVLPVLLVSLILRKEKRRKRRHFC